MTNKQNYEYVEPIEITENIYWVGYYDQKASFHCNPYLIIDNDEAILVDPGSFTDYPTVMSKVLSVVEPNQIKYIICHHQDPDLCASLPLVEELINSKDLKIITHERAAFLIKYYGTKSDYYLINKNKFELTLKSGRVFKFIMTPFCHFPAAFATLDTKNNVLFSSDLFAAFSQDWNLYAQPGYEKNMIDFHRYYMPSQKHLNHVMDAFEKVAPDIVLPQHGSIISKDFLPTCIQTLRNLKCGLDDLDE
ncbi:MAG: MBL fold metallo-hydrolase [bacterium]|nr:MBL fold metallo-hydrolase [bacterium]MBU1918608.1 MBL fold metallo-hydrolase [bacterium]